MESLMLFVPMSILGLKRCHWKRDSALPPSLPRMFIQELLSARDCSRSDGHSRNKTYKFLVLLGSLRGETDMNK